MCSYAASNHLSANSALTIGGSKDNLSSCILTATTTKPPSIHPGTSYLSIHCMTDEKQPTLPAPHYDHSMPCAVVHAARYLCLQVAKQHGSTATTSVSMTQHRTCKLMAEQSADMCATCLHPHHPQPNRQSAQAYEVVIGVSLGHQGGYAQVRGAPLACPNSTSRMHGSTLVNSPLH